MKQLVLSKDGSLKIKRQETSLYESDLEELPKSCISGEWVTFVNNKTKENYLGFVNNFVAQGNPQIRILGKGETVPDLKNFEPIEYLRTKITNSLNYRKQFNSLNSGSRLIFGESDGLPGLIVDEFLEIVLVQINTAGLDNYRNQIKEMLSEKIPSKKIYFFDHEKYRSLENLPQFKDEHFNQILKIKENNLNYEVVSQSLQKIGYYYDHRLNRMKAQNLVRDFKILKKSGLDLFCYIGSWGMNLLAAGVENIVFVDQGNFADAIATNLKLNDFIDRGEFIRSDVFKYLDLAISQKKSFDVICSDPPAFAKNLQSKNQALDGYQKLHTKILNLINPGGLILIGSCTHYVSIDELDERVSEAAKRTQKNIQLVDIGLQGPDHPIKNLKDKANYIKYLAYTVN